MEFNSDNHTLTIQTMSDNKTFLIVNAVPNMEDMQSFQSYLTQIVDIFIKFGGSNMQRFKTVEQIMGQGGIKAIAILEFPDAQSIKNMFASDEFNALNDLRRKAYKQEVDLMICETYKNQVPPLIHHRTFVRAGLQACAHIFPGCRPV